MGSSGKKKTTMAKLARENRLRERRLDKQAKKDARRQVSSDRPVAPEATTPGAVEESSVGPEHEAAVAGHEDEAERAFLDVESEPSDPRAKEVALTRLRDSRDEELAVFEDKLRDDALNAGATEQELREAQRYHPGHGG